MHAALCLSPDNPRNGNVTVTDNSVGGIAVYMCNSGFEVFGDAIATCTSDMEGNSASFMPVAPTCQRKFWSSTVYFTSS